MGKEILSHSSNCSCMFLMFANVAGEGWGAGVNGESEE